MVKMRAYIMLVLSMLALTACTGGLAEADAIQQAYSVPNVVKLQPYDRTIFSSTNF